MYLTVLPTREGQSVRAINATGFGDMPRKQIDALVDFAKGYEAKGLAYIANPSKMDH